MAGVRIRPGEEFWRVVQRLLNDWRLLTDCCSGLSFLPGLAAHTQHGVRQYAQPTRLDRSATFSALPVNSVGQPLQGNFDLRQLLLRLTQPGGALFARDLRLGQIKLIGIGANGRTQISLIPRDAIAQKDSLLFKRPSNDFSIRCVAHHSIAFRYRVLPESPDQ